MEAIDTGRSIICYEKGIVATWDNADNNCDAQFRAQICTFNQWRAVVCRVGTANPGRSWTSNVTGSASYATVSGCTSDSVNTSFFNGQGLTGPCCIEYMKY